MKLLFKQCNQYSKQQTGWVGGIHISSKDILSWNNLLSNRHEKSESYCEVIAYIEECIALVINTLRLINHSKLNYPINGTYIVP